MCTRAFIGNTTQHLCAQNSVLSKNGFPGKPQGWAPKPGRRCSGTLLWGSLALAPLCTVPCSAITLPSPPCRAGSSKPDPQGCLLAHLPKLGQRRHTGRSARQGEGQSRGNGTGHALCILPAHATPGLRQGSSCTSADGSHCQQRPSPGGAPYPGAAAPRLVPTMPALALKHFHSETFASSDQPTHP